MVVDNPTGENETNGEVLVGVDPDQPGVSALSWATEWCVVTNQSLLVVSAIHSEQSEVDPEFHKELIAEAHAEMERRVGSAAARKPVSHRSIISQGDPNDVVFDAAKSEDPSVVIIGSRGGGGFEGLGLGGVAHHLAHHVQRPMVVVPRLGGHLAGGTIVIGIDGSAGSRKALLWAVGAAKAAGGHIHAVFAYDPMADSYPKGTSNWQYKDEDEMRAELSGIDLTGVEIRTTRVGDNTVAALTEVANADAASLIVVGTRGRGGFHGLLLGRVPAQLLHHAGRPVALIHHPN